MNIVRWLRATALAVVSSSAIQLNSSFGTILQDFLPPIVNTLQCTKQPPIVIVKLIAFKSKNSIILAVGT